MQMSSRSKAGFTAFTLIIILAAAAPTVVQFFGHTFIASNDWIRLVTPAALVVGIALSTVAVAVVMRYRGGNENLKNASIARLLFVGIAVWAVSLVAFLTIAYKTVPMISASLVADEVTFSFTVDRTDSGQSGSRSCAGRLILQDRPYLARDLCGVPPTAQTALNRGSEIVAIGSGSPLGVFYDRFSVPD